MWPLVVSSSLWAQVSLSVRWGEWYLPLWNWWEHRGAVIYIPLYTLQMSDILLCKIIENIYIGLCPGFLPQSSSNPCNFLSDKSTRSIFYFNIWSLNPILDTKFLNSLGIFWVKGIMSFVLMMQLWVGSWLGAGHQKDQAMIRNLKFSVQPHTSFSREERGAGNEVNGWSCLRDEASIKNPKSIKFREFLGWWTPECSCLERAWKLRAPSHIPCPLQLFHLDIHLYPLSYPFIINW